MRQQLLGLTARSNSRAFSDVRDRRRCASVIDLPKPRLDPASYTGRVRTRCLSFHAAYRCRHAGECCRADWDIDVEPHIVEAVRSGRVRPVLSTPVAFENAPAPPGSHPGNPEAAPLQLSRTRAGECGFHIHERCSLQEAGTEAMLPSACRHFPRVYLRDARGSLLTLSHFCPTAAALLLDDRPVTIVDATAPLALQEPIEGLDARGALPPLVRLGLLADLSGYAAWEEAVIQTFIAAADAETALDQIDRATEQIRAWTPGAGELIALVTRAFAADPVLSRPTPLSRGFAIAKELTGAHPLMEIPVDFDHAWRVLRDDTTESMAPVVARYLAATAFGNWVAYRGQGLRSVAAWLRAAHDVLRIQLVRHRRAARGPLDMPMLLQSIRMTDYIMVHTVDSLAFGRASVALER